MHVATTPPAPRRVALSFERRQPCDVRLTGDDTGARASAVFGDRSPRRGESVRLVR